MRADDYEARPGDGVASRALDLSNDLDGGTPSILGHGPFALESFFLKKPARNAREARFDATLCTTR